MAQRKYLSIKLRKNILRLLEAGYGYRSIAKYFSINLYTAKTIRDIWKRGDLGYFGAKYKLQKHYYPIEFKIEKVEEYLASGKPLKTYCREKYLCHATFRGWVRRYQSGQLV